MSSNPESATSQRVLTVIFAAALGIAIVGFAVGTRPTTPPPRAKPDRTDRPPVGQARSYTELRTDRAKRTSKRALAGLGKAIPQAVPKRAPTAAQRNAALSARSRRRAYSGAPPVIPHGVTQKTSASCLTCHRTGAVVNGKVAPSVSHPEYASCTQCHVESQGRGPSHMPKAGNTFAGVRTAGRGIRASVGTPPTIPHSTWMRSRCIACHGPTGKPGLRTTHPQRRSCTQCHAPNRRLHPAAGIPR